MNLKAEPKSKVDFLERFLNQLNIQKKLIFMYLISFFIPSIIVTAIMSFWLNDTLLKKEIQETSSSVEKIEGRLGEIFNKIIDLSDRIFVNERIHSVVSKTYESPLETYLDYQSLDFLHDYLRAYPEIANFRLYVTNQTLLDNSYFVRTTPNIVFSYWYRQAIELNGRMFWSWKQDDITGQYHLALIRLIKNRYTMRAAGVLVINLEGSRMARLLAEEKHKTVIALDGDALFGLPKNEQKILRNLIGHNITMSQAKQVFSDLSWQGTKSVIYVNSFRPSRNLYNFFQIIQVIPISQLKKTTTTLIAFYSIILFFSLIASFLFIGLFSKYFWQRVKILRTEINKIVQHDFEIAKDIGGQDEFSDIHNALYSTVGQIKLLIDEVYVQRLKSEQILSRQNEIQFKMLSSQINPHFLFNSLETIRMMAITKNENEIARTVKVLSSLFRYNLEVSNKPVCLAKELESVKNYLEMQSIRFGERINYQFIYTVPNTDYFILPFLIQPLVENSFNHGLETTTDQGFIYISISVELGALCIKVRDNGRGIEKAKLRDLNRRLAECDVIQEPIKNNGKPSIGLINTNQRIKLFYGKQWGLKLWSVPGEQTTVALRIPVVLSP